MAHEPNAAIASRRFGAKPRATSSSPGSVYRIRCSLVCCKNQNMDPQPWLTPMGIDTAWMSMDLGQGIAGIPIVITIVASWYHASPSTLGKMHMRLLTTTVIHIVLAFGYNNSVFASTACSAPDGLAKIEGAKVVIFGDYHGTEEIPLFFYNAVCASSLPQNGTLVVGLELPTAFNKIFEPSNETTAAAAKEKLRQHEFWNVMGDGRHSAAMLALVQKLLALSQVNRQIKLIALGNEHIDTSGAELLMSRIRGSDTARALVLVGNAHAQTRIIPRYNIKPFGAALLDSGVSVLSLNIETSGGEAWLCRTRDTCGPASVPVTKGDPLPGIHLSGCKANCRYQGTYFIKHLSVTSPVRVAD